MNNLVEILNSGGERFIRFALPMLLQSSVLIVILLAADLVLRMKVRATFRYWLWILVLLKLVLPPTFSTPVSFGRIVGDKIVVGGLKEAAPATSEGPMMVKVEVPSKAVITRPLDASGTEAASAEWSRKFVEAPVIPTAANAGEPVEKGMLSWQAIALVVWAGAAVAMVLLVVQRVFFVVGLIRQAQPAQGLLTETLEFCRKRMGVNLPIRLKVSANATSPAVCGLFRPVILVPQDIGPSLGPSHLRPVLLHELGHIKRGDLWVNLAQTVLQIIYFYNPLLWLANTIIRRIREQAVDEMIQVAMGERAEQYPETLLSVAKLAFGRPALALRFIGVVESKSQLQGRIKKMLNQPIPKTAKLGFAGLAAIIISAALLLPMAAGGKNESGQMSFTAALPNGVTVELMGTCQYTAEGIDCFQPDGLPLGRELRIAKWNQKPKAGDTGIMLKVSGPEDLSLSYHKIEGTKGWEGSCHVVDANGRELQGWEAALTRFDNDQKTTTAKFGVAAGEWKTVAEHTGRSMGIFNGITFTIATETEKGVQIYTSDALGQDVTQRIIAIDNDGNLHPWKGSTGSVSNSQIRQSIGTFPNLKLDQIRKFQFQTRPYDWVQFKNVSLKPNLKTNVQIEVEEFAGADKTSSQACENNSDEVTSTNAEKSPHASRSADDSTSVYQVNKSVADFAEGEDLSTPEAAYAAINRVSASGDESGWARVSVKRLAAEFAGGKKSAVDPEWAAVLLNAQILEVRIFDNRIAMVAAELPQRFSSKPIRRPIDVRHLEFEDGRWLNAGNDRVNTLGEAAAISLRRAAEAVKAEGQQGKGAQTELAYDDGKSAGKWSFSGGGHGVRFTAPSGGCVLKSVKFYGSRYGEYEAPKEDFDVWVCDKNFNVIANFKFPYSLFSKRGHTDWVTMNVDDVKVPKEFAVCVAFDPHQTKGIYVYHDAKGSGRSYQGIPPQMEPFKDGDWMIRAVVEATAAQVVSSSKPSRADRMEAENLAGEGWKLWSERKLAEAEELFRQAVEKDPGNASGWNGLGWSQQNQGKTENARYSFERCLELEPRHAAALNGLGWIAKGEGKTDEAIDYWKKAVAVSDGQATASLSGLAQTYMALEQYDQAAKYYEMWLKVEPNNKEVKNGLSKARAMQK